MDIVRASNLHALKLALYLYLADVFTFAGSLEQYLNGVKNPPTGGFFTYVTAMGLILKGFKSL